jgi:hypothetical protein
MHAWKWHKKWINHPHKVYIPSWMFSKLSNWEARHMRFCCVNCNKCHEPHCNTKVADGRHNLVTRSLFLGSKCNWNCKVRGRNLGDEEIYSSDLSLDTLTSLCLPLASASHSKPWIYPQIQCEKWNLRDRILNERRSRSTSKPLFQLPFQQFLLTGFGAKWIEWFSSQHKQIFD